MSKFAIKGDNFLFHESEVKSDDFEILSQSQDRWVLKYKSNVYHCDVIEFDRQQKRYLLSINGQEIEFSLMDEVDLMVEEMGMNEVVVQNIDKLLAPMPGLVLSIDVEVGQEISEGENLLILEAMKMENIIKAPGKGTVKKINVSKSEKVEKDQLLIEFE